MNPVSLGHVALALCWVALTPVLAIDDAPPVSYYREVVPVLKRSCTGCHHPGKLKGELDLTSYESFKKGGKHGASFLAGKTTESRVLEEISGSEPSMPKEGDPLSKVEVTLVERWIQEGATNDTPAGADSFKLAAPPAYTAPPVISALAYSPDGKLLAISGYHEVLIHAGDASKLLARLVGESPRIESLAFSEDGKRLGVTGSAPARFGEIQIWDVTEAGLAAVSPAPLKSYKISLDAVYGLSFSRDGTRVAIGGADKSVRIIRLEDGKEILKFDNHSDVILGTTWTTNGNRLLTCSRDKALKLLDVSSGQFIDDINKLLEGALCFSRHPTADLIVYGGDLGTARIYKISDNQGRTAANNDVNLVKEFERLPGPIQAIAYSPDGRSIAMGGASAEVRIYDAKEAKRLATFKGHEGAIFALAYAPNTNQLSTAGYDGMVRIYETDKGTLIKSFIPVPLEKPTATAHQQAAK